MCQKVFLLLLIVCIYSKHIFVSAADDPLTRIKHHNARQGYIVPCFVANWAQYRPDGYAFTTSDVDPSLCTHIIFAYYHVQDNVVVSTEWNDEAQLSTLVAYKDQYPDLKVMVSIGGWEAGSTGFSPMVQTPVTRQTFIDSLIDLIRSQSLDGIDINWEFPTFRGGQPSDKQLYTMLLQEMREAFDEENSGWLISSTQTPRLNILYDSYEIEDIAREVDFINIMTYDYYGHSDTRLGIHSNLFDAPDDENDYKNANFSVRLYIDEGAPADKLVLGVVSCGDSSIPCLNDSHTPGVDFSCGVGSPGPITGTPGLLSYYEICMVKIAGYTHVYDDVRVGEYAYGDNQWVGYDTPLSIVTKCDYIKANGLAGGFMWELSMDDFGGRVCSGREYPLLQALYHGLRSD